MVTSRRKSPGEDKERARAAQSFLATIVCVLGLILAVGGLLAVFVGGDVTASSVSAEAVGIGLGIVGYALGARRLAFATIVLCVLTPFFGLAAGQGYIPCFKAYDRGLPDVETNSQG